MKTYLFTFDVNGGDDIKTGVLQSQNTIFNETNEKEEISEIVMKCLKRFVYVNESNIKVLEEEFWKSICCFLKKKIHNKNENLFINILSLHLINDQTEFNRKLTHKDNKYDIFINCCNPDPIDDYFIYDKQKVVFFNVNEYTTKEVHFV